MQLSGGMAVLLKSLFQGVDFTTPETAMKTAFPSVDLPKVIAQFQTIVEWTERVDSRLLAQEEKFEMLRDEIRVSIGTNNDCGTESGNAPAEYIGQCHDGIGGGGN